MKTPFNTLHNWFSFRRSGSFGRDTVEWEGRPGTSADHLRQPWESTCRQMSQPVSLIASNLNVMKHCWHKKVSYTQPFSWCKDFIWKEKLVKNNHHCKSSNSLSHRLSITHIHSLSLTSFIFYLFIYLWPILKIKSSNSISHDTHSTYILLFSPPTLHPAFKQQSEPHI